MSSSRSLLVLLVLGCLVAGRVHGQEQERKLMDRLQRPDMSKSFNLNSTAFGSDRSYRSNSARVKTFYSPKSFFSKTFRSKEYGTKQSQYVENTYATKGASTRGKYEVPNVNAKAPTKTMSVKEAREGGKTMDVARYDRAEKNYNEPGRSQDKFNSERSGPKDNKPLGYSGDLKVMTIDDVRELLNKNK